MRGVLTFQDSDHASKKREKQPTGSCNNCVDREQSKVQAQHKKILRIGYRNQGCLIRLVYTTYCVLGRSTPNGVRSRPNKPYLASARNKRINTYIQKFRNVIHV